MSEETLKSLVTYFKSETNLDDVKATLYLKRAEADILDQTNRIELLPRMEMLVLDLALNYHGQTDRAGISSYSEGAISISYFENAPLSLQNRILAYRLIHGVKYGS